MKYLLAGIFGFASGWYLMPKRSDFHGRPWAFVATVIATAAIITATGSLIFS